VLLGDAVRPPRRLGGEPKVHFPEPVRMMVQADLDRSHALSRG
jgi:GDP-D-mannose dehydratase